MNINEDNIAINTDEINNLKKIKYILKIYIIFYFMMKKHK